MPLDGTAVAAGTAGVVLLASALTGKGILAEVRDIVSGKAPAKIPAAGSGGSGVTATGGTVSSSSNRDLGKLLAAPYGWSTGEEWTALDNIVMAESGWNANAANPTSDARGIAQNINGWGPGYEPGNATQQINWLLSYIKGRYVDPVDAWRFHLANGWY